MKDNNLLIDRLFPITTSVNSDDALTIANLNIHELAHKFGTPLYIYDYETIKKIYNDFYNAFEMQYGEVDILYASKVFLNLPFAKLLYNIGVKFDVVSHGEMSMLIASKIGLENAYFHGNNKTVEELFRNVQKYMRVNVNRAKKRGINVIEIKSKNQLNDYYNLEKKWISTKGITTEEYEYDLEKDWGKIDTGNEKIFLAYQNEEVISGLRINYFNKIASPVRVLSTYSNLTSLGGPALTWHAIEWSKKSGMKIYDLTGGEASPKNKNKIFAYEKKWGNLLKYKRKWGGNEQAYFHFIKVRKSFKYKMIRLLSKPDQIYRNYKHSKIK